MTQDGPPTIEVEAKPADDVTRIATPQAGVERIKATLEPIIGQRVRALESEIAPLVARAGAAITPTTQDEANAIGLLRSEIASKKRAIEAERLATTRPIDAFKNWIMARIAPITGDLETAEAALASLVKTYQAAERRKAEEAAEIERLRKIAEDRARAEAEAVVRKADEERRAAEARAEAERQAEEARKAVEVAAERRATEARLAAEKAAAEAPSRAEAERLRLAAEDEAAAASQAEAEAAERIDAEARRKADIAAQWAAEEVAEAELEAQARLDAELTAVAEPVKVETAKVAGSSSVEHWSFEIVEAAAVPREYLVPDEKAIRAAVNKGGIREIAGVRVFRDDVIRSR